MAKKTPATKTKAKATTAVKAAKTTKMKQAQAPKAAPASSGMWKILEQKKQHLKEMEQARTEGRSNGHNSGQSFHANPRDPRFSKFAGPRRKAG